MTIVGDTPPFDTSGFDPQGNKVIDDIMSDYGITSWDELFAVGMDVDSEDIRTTPYFTPEEALDAMNRGGIIGISYIYYDDDEGLYYIVVTGSD